ncbi:MAG: hypothetical protein LUE29_06830 [Lachnospiraceae bacterium]|nr:hypothetical protein [Lachnospiraceae bacterium]
MKKINGIMKLSENPKNEERNQAKTRKIEKKELGWEPEVYERKKAVCNLTYEKSIVLIEEMEDNVNEEKKGFDRTGGDVSDPAGSRGSVRGHIRQR